MSDRIAVMNHGRIDRRSTRRRRSTSGRQTGSSPTSSANPTSSRVERRGDGVAFGGRPIRSSHPLAARERLALVLRPEKLLFARRIRRRHGATASTAASSRSIFQGESVLRTWRWPTARRVGGPGAGARRRRRATLRAGRCRPTGIACSTTRSSSRRASRKRRTRAPPADDNAAALRRDARRERPLLLTPGAPVAARRGRCCSACRSAGCSGSRWSTRPASCPARTSRASPPTSRPLS